MHGIDQLPEWVSQQSVEGRPGVMAVSVDGHPVAELHWNDQLYTAEGSGWCWRRLWPEPVSAFVPLSAPTTPEPVDAACGTGCVASVTTADRAVRYALALLAADAVTDVGQRSQL